MTSEQAKAWALKHLTGTDDEIARAPVELESTTRENMAVECDFQAEDEEADGSPEHACDARMRASHPLRWGNERLKELTMTTERKRATATKSMTEEQAVAALQRLAARWPQTLTLVHSASAGRVLHVKREDPSTDDLEELETLAVIHGLNANSCA